MKEKIQKGMRLWKNGGIRRWSILLLTGILLVILAIPLDSLTKEQSQGTEAQTEAAEGYYAQQSKGQTRLKQEEISQTTTAGVTEYEQELERRLTELLSQIQGAGKVQVMVTVSRSSEQILQQDTSEESQVVQETDAQGGSRNNQQLRQEHQTVLTGGSGTLQPYVIGEIMPIVEGVVVACEGGDRPTIQAEISAAIQALFDLAPHKIKVCKMASP